MLLVRVEVKLFRRPGVTSGTAACVMSVSCDCVTSVPCDCCVIQVTLPEFRKWWHSSINGLRGPAVDLVVSLSVIET